MSGCCSGAWTSESVDCECAEMVDACECAESGVGDELGGGVASGSGGGVASMLSVGVVPSVPMSRSKMLGEGSEGGGLTIDPKGRNADAGGGFGREVDLAAVGILEDLDRTRSGGGCCNGGKVSSGTIGLGGISTVVDGSAPTFFGIGFGGARVPGRMSKLEDCGCVSRISVVGQSLGCRRCGCAGGGGATSNGSTMGVLCRAVVGNSRIGGADCVDVDGVCESTSNRDVGVVCTGCVSTGCESTSIGESGTGGVVVVVVGGVSVPLPHLRFGIVAGAGVEAGGIRTI